MEIKVMGSTPKEIEQTLEVLQCERNESTHADQFVELGLTDYIVASYLKVLRLLDEARAACAKQAPDCVLHVNHADQSSSGPRYEVGLPVWLIQGAKQYKISGVVMHQDGFRAIWAYQLDGLDIWIPESALDAARQWPR